jgi:predicted ABC-type exoprotein transport system permease subunit
MSHGLRSTVLWAMLAVVLFFSVSPLAMKPDDLFSIPVDQFVSSALLSVLFILLYPGRIGIILIGALLLPLLTEVAQFSLPDRYGYAPDIVVKTLGALFGVALGWAWIKTRPLRFAMARQRRAIRDRHKRLGL